MKRTHSAGGVVINADGRVLVVNQNNNSWSLPKGHVDLGEDALTAAKREIYEESGVKSLQFLKKMGKYERPRIGLTEHEDISELKSIELFLFKTSESDLKPIDLNNPEARWVDAESVAHLLTHPKDKEFFLMMLPDLIKYRDTGAL